MVDKTKDGLYKSVMSKKVSKPSNKTALELDKEITKKGKEFSSPEMLRSQARRKKSQEEEAIITKKNSNSLLHGLKGLAIGSNRMGAQEAQERNEREGVRNAKAKEEEKSIKEMLRKRR